VARLGSAEKKQKYCSRQEVVGREVPLEEEGKVRKLGSFRAKDGVDVLEGLDLKYLAGILKTTYDEDAWSNEYELEGTQPDKGGRHAVAMSLQNIKKLRDDWGWLKRTETAFAPTKVRSVRLVVMRYAGMFTIPKPSGLHRRITNGKAGNAVMRKSPVCRFFTKFCIISQRLVELGSFYSYSADIRQWYNRMKMNVRMGSYYVIPTVEGDCVPTVLIMGAHAAPAMGQAGTIAIVLRQPPGGGELGVQVEDGVIPAIMEIRQESVVVGYIFVIIDRLRINAQALGGSPFKEEVEGTEANYQFIGIDYRKEAEETPKWRHCGVRVKKWKERYAKDDGVTLKEFNKPKDICRNWSGH